MRPYVNSLIKSAVLSIALFTAATEMRGEPVPQGSAPVLRSDFTVPGGGVHWKPNQWKGYHPFPEFGNDPKEKAFHVKPGTGKYGFGFVNQKQRIAARAGQKIAVELTAKGTGEIFVGLQNFSKGKYVAVAKSAAAGLQPEWQRYKLEIPVVDSKQNQPTDSVMLTFGGRKNTELYLKDLSASAIDGK